MRHVQILVKKNCWNYDQAMDPGIAKTAKLNAAYAVVVFLMITKQFNVTNVKCGFTMTALSSLIFSMNQCNIQVVHGFVPNVIFSDFSASFFSEQLNLEDQNRFISLAKDGETGLNNYTFGSGLKFSSIKRQWYKDLQI